MTTLFVSDLHLDATRPDTTQAFLDFLRTEARQARALYVLGDLFEAWVGDDDRSGLAQAVAKALCALEGAGVPVAFMHGNRDFLLGREYATRCGMALLPDPTVVMLDGEATLLMHGDTLCTGDVAYQQFRAQVRDPRWQAQFLSQPLDARLAFAAQARTASRQHQAGLADAGTMETLADVSPATVEHTFVHYGVRRLIHGHTHRPGVHALDVDGHACERIVLGDWYDQGSVLRVDGGRAELAGL